MSMMRLVTPKLSMYSLVTENQVGVAYTAPADAGAVIEFSNDLENDSSTIDNFGMMTTRRTFVDLVPRDFAVLNELPAT